MALFGITLKKLESIPGDLIHDVFGGGNNNQPQSAPPTNNGVYQSPASQAAAAVKPPAVATPPAFNPVLNPPPQQQNQNKKTNPVTGFLENDIVKPIVQPFVGTAKALAVVPAAIGREIQNKPITDLQQKAFGTTDPGKIAEKIVGNTAGVGLTVAAPGIDSAAENAAAKFLPETASKVIGTAVPAAGFGAASGASQGGNAKEVAESAAIGGALGGASRLIAPAAKMVGSEVADRVRSPVSPPEEPTINAPTATEPKAPKSTAKVKVTTQPTTTATPTGEGLTIPQGAPLRTAQAAQKISDLYDNPSISADSSKGLIRKAIGYSRLFSDAGNELQKAMGQDLTEAERIGVRDNLEGVTTQDSIKPKVQAVADISRQLNDKGYDVLDTTHKTPVHRVQQYATRLINSTNKPGEANGFGDIKSLFNVHSGFANNRAVGKFVSSRGDVEYGTKSDLGLTTDKNGNLKKDGVVYKQQPVSTAELNANSPYNYENDYGRIANTYHSSVGRVQVGKAAADELASNPEKYGLTKEPLPGYEPIRQVPQLEGYFAPSSAAKDIDAHLGAPPVQSVPERAFQALTRGVIQSIVYNPLFHGRNLNELAGLAAGKAKGAFGPAQLKMAYAQLADMSPEDRSALGERMLKAGVVKETYGADRDTILTKAADSAGLPHLSKISSAPMAKIDWGIRSSLFHLVTSGDNPLSDEQAAALVNHFLGDAESSGPVARNVGLFWHYMKTRVGIIKDALQHPDENAGTLVAAAEQAAFLYGTTKAFQQWTGNKHASLGHPGLFGVANDVKDIVQGQGNAVATSTMNPVVVAALNQLYGKDLYTGNDISGGKARLQNAEQTLLSPAQTVSKVGASKESPAQAGLQALTGITTPHVKGAPAVPNKGPLDFLNQKGAKAVADEGNIHDPTGIQQAELYYNAKDKALQAVAGNPEATDAINAYLDNNTNAQGQSVKKDPQEALGVANLVAGSPEALKAIQAMEKSQPGHDPMWDLSAKDLKTFMNYEGSRDETGERTAMELLDSKFNNGQGLKQFIAQRAAYYNNSNFQGSSLPNPLTPTFPTFKGQQQTDYQTYESQFKNSTDSKAKAQFIDSHPDVADALLQLNNYYNNLNVAQGGLPVKGSVQLTPAQQQWYNYYDSLPSGTGARSAAIKANPTMWQSISASLAQSDLISLAQQGAIDQYQGVPFSQTFLKDAYDAGKYDITPNVPLPSGGMGFAISNGQSSSSSGSGSSSSSSSTTSKIIAEEKANSQARDAEHAAKAANNAVKYAQKAAKLKTPKRLSVHMKGEKRVSPYRVKQVSLAPKAIKKVSLKAPKGLSHAKLKV